MELTLNIFSPLRGMTAGESAATMFVNSSLTVLTSVSLLMGGLKGATIRLLARSSQFNGYKHKAISLINIVHINTFLFKLAKTTQMLTVLSAKTFSLTFRFICQIMCEICTINYADSYAKRSTPFLGVLWPLQSVPKAVGSVLIQRGKG